MPKKIALVTGASRGLGFAIAIALAAQGFHIIALARTSGGLEDLDDIITSAHGTTTLVPLDITDESGLQRMAQAVQQRWGKLDLLVHCAAHAAPLAPASQVNAKDFDKSWAINVKATLSLIAATEDLLRAGKGHAVFIDDPRAGHAFTAAYGASKLAQKAIATAWQGECTRLGPKITFFTPNPMPTALRARFHPGEDRAKLASCENEAARLLAQITA